jgi:hypothetical protein
VDAGTTLDGDLAEQRGLPPALRAGDDRSIPAFEQARDEPVVIGFGLIQEVVEVQETIPTLKVARPLGDLLDHPAGVLDRPGGVLRGLVAELDELVAGVDDPAQGGEVADPAGVVVGAGRGGHAGDQGVQERCPADVGQDADPVELAGNGDRVDRVATAVQDGDGGVDTSVCGAVEVILAELAENDGQGVG